jgi:hypothetical protein
MSYEGHQQIWCKNGHYWEVDVYGEAPQSCPTCMAKVAFVNDVDDTNGDSYGYIKPIEKAAAQCCTCNCGNKHVIVPARYEIPQKRSRARSIAQDKALRASLR